MLIVVDVIGVGSCGTVLFEALASGSLSSVSPMPSANQKELDWMHDMPYGLSSQLCPFATEMYLMSIDPHYY